MLNFAVGPVQSSEEVLAVGAEQVPYFRTAEFSQVMLENERIMLQLADAPEGSRTVFLTGSGTASMEAAVINTLDGSDKALVVNGGSFGNRFAQLCAIHEIPYEEIKLEPGRTLTEQHLAPYENAGFTAFIVNLDETSTGVLYDIDLISDFCTRNGLYLIVDAVSAFLADPLSMEKSHVGLMLTGSQKALACPPGISLIVLAPEALERVERIDPHCMYLNLADALKNGERGQTPFTPAVGTLLQINVRLRELAERGLEDELARVAARCRQFREGIANLPFELFAETPATAVTSLRVKEGVSTEDINNVLKSEYGIWICPNGGELGKHMFRVGHIGALSEADVDALLKALHELNDRGMLGA